jgi:hypothetical protein
MEWYAGYFGQNSQSMRREEATDGRLSCADDVFAGCAAVTGLGSLDGYSKLGCLGAVWRGVEALCRRQALTSCCGSGRSRRAST